MSELLLTEPEHSSQALSRLMALVIEGDKLERAENASARAKLSDMFQTGEPSTLMSHEMVELLVDEHGFSSDAALQAVTYHTRQGNLIFAS